VSPFQTVITMQLRDIALNFTKMFNAQMYLGGCHKVYHGKMFKRRKDVSLWRLQSVQWPIICLDITKRAAVIQSS